MKIGDLQRALALYPSIFEKPLSSREVLSAHAHFARAFFETRQYRQATVECQAVLRQSPKDTGIKVLQARILYATKMISEQSLPYYAELFLANPWNLELLIFVASFCVKKAVSDPVVLPVLRAAAQA